MRKAYYEANREKLLARYKARYEANREKIAAQQKAFRADNRELVARRKKTYYDTHREQIKARNKAKYYTAESIAKRKAYLEANRERMRIKRKEYNDAHPGRHRKALLMKEYGLTLEEYEQMFEAQKGYCAICGGRSQEHLAVDHCHETRKIRGLLCRGCNLGIGHIKTPALCNAAASYLERNNHDEETLWLAANCSAL